MGTEELAVIESKALSIATEAHAGQVDKGGCENICPFLEVLWYHRRSLGAAGPPIWGALWIDR